MKKANDIEANPQGTKYISLLYDLVSKIPNKQENKWFPVNKIGNITKIGKLQPLKIITGLKI